HLELAGGDDVQLIAGIALPEQHRPPADAARLHEFEQRTGRFVVEPGEERSPAYDFDVHLVPPDRYTSASQSTRWSVVLPTAGGRDPQKRTEPCSGITGRRGRLRRARQRVPLSEGRSSPIGWSGAVSR